MSTVLPAGLMTQSYRSSADASESRPSIDVVVTFLSRATEFCQQKKRHFPAKNVARASKRRPPATTTNLFDCAIRRSSSKYSNDRPVSNKHAEFA